MSINIKFDYDFSICLIFFFFFFVCCLTKVDSFTVHIACLNDQDVLKENKGLFQSIGFEYFDLDDLHITSRLSLSCSHMFQSD